MLPVSKRLEGFEPNEIDRYQLDDLTQVVAECLYFAEQLAEAVVGFGYARAKPGRFFRRNRAQQFMTLTRANLEAEHLDALKQEGADLEPEQVFEQLRAALRSIVSAGDKSTQNRGLESPPNGI